MPAIVSARDRIDRYLDSNGDGTGTKNMVGDYSGWLPGEFEGWRIGFHGRGFWAVFDV
jgi:hypothetical protein